MAVARKIKHVDKSTDEPYGSCKSSDLDTIPPSPLSVVSHSTTLAEHEKKLRKPNAIMKKIATNFLVTTLSLYLLYGTSPPEDFPTNRTWNSSSIQAWRLLIWFLLTIVGCIMDPFPLPTLCILSLFGAVTLKILPLKDEFVSVACADGQEYISGTTPLYSCGRWVSSTHWSPLSGFAQPAIWLIVVAFMISDSVDCSGLGRRMGYIVIKAFGGSVLNLGFAVGVCECVFCLIIPSQTARGAGIMLPILLPIIRDMLGSDPANGTEEKAGKYLILLMVTLNNKMSNMFPTAAANALILQRFAADLGDEISYINWAISFIPHMLCQMILCPLILYYLYPPTDGSNKSQELISEETEVLITEPKDDIESNAKNQNFSSHTSVNGCVEMNKFGTSKKRLESVEEDREFNISFMASKKLQEMGPLSGDEWIVICVMSVTIILWATYEHVSFLKHLNTTMIALGSVGILLAMGVLNLKKNVAGNVGAWSTFLWFSVLLMFSGRLKDLGVFDYLANVISPAVCVGNAYLSILLAAILYSLTTYLFASTGARVVAMSKIFMIVLIQSSVPVRVTTRVIIMMTGTGYLTPYSNAVNVPLFAQNYVKEKKIIFSSGLLMLTMDLTTVMTLDLFWWKLLGFWDPLDE